LELAWVWRRMGREGEDGVEDGRAFLNVAPLRREEFLLGGAASREDLAAASGEEEEGISVIQEGFQPKTNSKLRDSRLTDSLR